MSCCDTLALIKTHRASPQMISVAEAVKSQDAGFMTYPITTTLGETVYQVKHRYSEFEALRKLLVKAHPSILVPPIPEKHTIGDLTNGKKKTEQMVGERQRLLCKFLQRVAGHDSLVNFHPFHQFLQGSLAWADIVQSSGLGHMLHKSPSLANVNSPTIRKPDTQFQGAQEFTVRFQAQIGFLYKQVRKIIGQYQAMYEANTELGMHYNGWSLCENGQSRIIEQMGQAFDSHALLLKDVQKGIDHSIGEGFHEYSLFATAIEKLLKYRNKKHAEFEQTSELLIQKQSLLTKLESTEYEAQRIAAVLREEGVQPKEKGLMATIGSLMDNDPEGTRRNTISKTKDTILTLEHDREQSRIQLLELNAQIQKELDAFQRCKIRDFQALLKHFVKVNREYHVNALEVWREALKK